MNIYNKVQRWLGAKSVRGVLLVVALLVTLAVIYSLGTSKAEEQVQALPPVVTVTTATQYAGNSTINLIGTVNASSEAAITTETAGRVTSVRVGLGDTVAAGQIIATIENASQQAAVLQAEGSYDAALAAAAQSGVGTDEAATRLRNAQNGAVATNKTAYATVEGVVFNNIDQFFSNPRGTVPGVRIDGAGFTQQLNATRVDFQTLLPTWKARVEAVTVTSDLEAELEYSAAQVAKTRNFVDTFITIFNSQGSNSRYTDTELQAFSTTFNSLRNSLIQAQSQIDTAQSNLDSAQEGVDRARLAASGGTSSAADAQIKQALGSLRAAQANLAKTIIRSPISGTINSIDIKTGEFVNSFAEVAEVANNNALEIVTFIGESDRAVIAVGDSVMLDDTVVGTVTRIAPAVNAGTGKTEVRISSESSELQNGDSVRITKQVEGEAITQVVIPLSAVKFALNDGSVFVIEDGVLSQREVTLGTIRGGSVEITDGLSTSTEFVADARGLVEGTEVEVTR